MSLATNQTVSGTSAGFSKECVATEAANGSTQFPRAEWQDSVFFKTQVASNNYHKGDNLLAVVWLRGSNFQAGSGMVQLSVQGANGGLAARRAVVTGTWHPYYLYAVADSDAPSNAGLNATLKIAVNTGYEHQTVEIGGVAVINYGSNSAGLATINGGGYNYDTYAGKGAADNGTYASAIDANRRVNLTVVAKDGNGNPISKRFREDSANAPRLGLWRGYGLLLPA